MATTIESSKRSYDSVPIKRTNKSPKVSDKEKKTGRLCTKIEKTPFKHESSKVLKDFANQAAGSKRFIEFLRSIGIKIQEDLAKKVIEKNFSSLDRKKIVEDLSRNGVDIDEQVMAEALVEAAVGELSIELVQILLNHGAEINHEYFEQDSRTTSPTALGLLFYEYTRSKDTGDEVKAKKMFNVICFLIESGAHVNFFVGDDYICPLEYAATTNSVSFGRLLIKNKADINSECGDEATPIKNVYPEFIKKIQDMEKK